MPTPTRGRKAYDHYKTCLECSRPVSPWSRYCQSHARRLRVHGHPLARPIRLSSLIRFAVMARQVIDRNPDHPGMNMAFDELQGLLDDAKRRSDAGQELAPDYALWLGLLQRGVTPLDIITMLSAAVLYEHMSGDPAKNTQAYWHRVARAVLTLGHLKPGGRDLPAGPQRTIGRFLLDRYGPLVTSITIVARAADRKRAERQDAMTAPLR